MDEQYDWVRIGRALRALRMDQGLTMRDVEARSGISRQTISSLERGRRPKLGTVDALAQVYGVGPHTIYIMGLGAPPKALLDAIDQGLIRDATDEELIRLRAAEELLGRPCDAWDYQSILALMRRKPQQ